MGPLRIKKDPGRHWPMASLAKEGVSEPPFHGILLPGSGFDLCANFQEVLNIMMLLISLAAKGGGFTEMMALRL